MSYAGEAFLTLCYLDLQLTGDVPIKRTWTNSTASSKARKTDAEVSTEQMIQLVEQWPEEK